MVRMTQDWFWNTLWWSPDPKSDIGADRPANWQMTAGADAYNMCSVAAFEGEGLALGCVSRSDILRAVVTVPLLDLCG